MSLIRKTEKFPAWPNFLNDFFDRDWLDWNNRNFSDTNTTLPAVNIAETADCFEVELAAPGFEKADFKIEVNNNILTVSSEKKVVNETRENQKFIKREFSYQSFSRTFTLPETVDNDQISAKYEEGVLKVEIPKKEEAKVKPVKAIEIQ